MPKLTIGMPHYDDPVGCIFTAQSLLLHHGDNDMEVLIIDASPGTPAGKDVAGFVAKTNSPKLRYVALKENRGPAANKNAVFTNALGEIVLCLDCHVLLPPGTVAKLLEYFSSNCEFRGLLTGPLLHADGGVSTHFDDVWRGAMCGTWATDKQLADPAGEPLPVWGQGCGFFACRKDAWLGFHPDALGFGAEEGCIHEKFRQAGHQTICHPALRWWHHFGKAGRGHAPVYLWHKVRNYVLEFQSMGKNVAPIYEHFVSLDTRGEPLEKHLVEEHSADVKAVQAAKDNPAALEAMHKRYTLTEAEWAHLLADPIKHTQQPPRPETIETHCDKLAANKASDVNQHMAAIRELAGRPDVELVTEVNRRHELTAAALAAKPKAIRAYWFGPTVSAKEKSQLTALAGETDLTIEHTANYQRPDIDPCDLLIVKPPHNHHQLMADLVAWEPRVAKFIAIHDTSAHGVSLDDGSLGYGLQIRAFLLDHKDWEVASHHPQQYGLTVLARQEQPRTGALKDPWPPGKGPGTNLKRMLAGMGVNPSPTCSCNRLMIDMDHWGAEGCKANREQILKGIGDNYEKWNWKEKLHLIAAAGKAVMSGLAFKLDPLHPVASLVDEAIRQAEVQQRGSEAA